MKRIVSVWLPLWPIERMRRNAQRDGTARAVPDDVPLALVESGSRGIRISAVNRQAAREGVRLGAALADARAALPALMTRPAEPRRDRAALAQLARWAGRYGPNRNSDGADGLWIDITGVAHLFAGEDELLADLSARLVRIGATARLGLADTLGGAHALARFSATPHRPWSLARTGDIKTALTELPVEALRLDAGTVLLLRRLGLKHIGQLYDVPRAALEQRFRASAAAKSKAGASPARTEALTHAHAVLSRLDMALGLKDEPRRPLAEPPVLAVHRLFPDLLISSEALEEQVRQLTADLAGELSRQSLGSRAIRLSLYRADGTMAEISAGLSTPSRDAPHLFTLLEKKLTAVDAGFGIDTLALEALEAARLDGRQSALDTGAAHAADEAAATLIDRLAGRLGPTCTIRLSPHASHIPERAEQHLSALTHLHYEPPWPYAKGPLRPSLLLPAPEPIAVMAEVPEGPPQRFTWRRVLRRVVRAQGPERIAPEWWRVFDCARDSPPASRLQALRPRDYYRIEDDKGGLYWVFREGLYERTSRDGAPRWFLHGLFG